MKRYLLFKSTGQRLDYYLMKCTSIKHQTAIDGTFIATTYKGTCYKFGEPITCYATSDHILFSDDLQECMDMMYLEML